MMVMMVMVGIPMKVIMTGMPMITVMMLGRR